MATQAAPHSNASGIQPVSPGQPHILAFVGENENGILQWWTDKILEAFAARGLSYKLIDLRDAAWRKDLTACLSVRNPEFCFSFQGMRMALPLPSGGNLWERIGQHFMDGRAMASVLSAGHPENPLADRTPWSKRKHNIVLVKTGIAPNTFTPEWNAWPKQVRELLYDCAAHVPGNAL
jgi:hypothetical protein